MQFPALDNSRVPLYNGCITHLRRLFFMKRNHAIDAVRAVACAFVLFVHATFPNPFGLYVAAAARFAVPFFLMVSGYYAFCSEEAGALRVARRRLVSTAKLTFIGTLFYAVSNTGRQLLQGQPAFSWLDSLLNPQGLFNFFVYNRAIFLSSVMYYLFMLLYVYGIFILLIKTRTLKAAYACIPVLLIACVALDEFFGQPWYYAGNFLLTGLPFFLLGHFFAHRPPRFAHPGRLILPGLLLTLVETALFGEAYCYVGTLMTAIGLFLFCLNAPDVKLPQALVRFGRSCSVTVFIIHCAVRDYLNMLIPEQPVLLAYARPLAVLAASCALALALAHIKARKKPMLA